MNINKFGSEVTHFIRKVESVITNVAEHTKSKTTIVKNNLVRTPDADEYIRIGLKIDNGSGVFENYNNEKQLISSILRTEKELYSTEMEKIFDYSTGKRKLVRIDYRTSNTNQPFALTRATIDPETRLCTELEHYDHDGKLLAKVSGIDSEGYATYAEWENGRYIAKYDESTKRSLFIDNYPSELCHHEDYTLSGKINLYMLDAQRYPVISLTPSELATGAGNVKVDDFLRREHW